MSKKGDSGEISATVDESNKLRETLGLRPLETSAQKTDVGSSNNPVDAVAEKVKAGSKVSDAEVRRQKAAAKNKKEHEDLIAGDGLADILSREEGKGGAADWINRTRNADGSMKGAAAAAAAAAAAVDSKKRKKEAKDAEVSGLKVRHDHSQIIDGSEVTMVLSDKPILNKDGEIDNSVDELSNVRLIDDERAKQHDAIRKQVEYDPTKEGQDILEKYNEIKTGPKGFILGGSTMGIVEETDPEKRLAILTAMSQKHDLEVKQKFQSDFYTAEEMNKLRKPPKKKT